MRFKSLSEPVSRRQALLLASTAAAAAAVTKTAWAAPPHIGRGRISAITDEIARSQAGAIEFAKQYGLQWLELRSVPGARKEYFLLPEADLKQAAREFSDAGVKISFLNTSMLKYWMPGTEPARANAKKDPTRFEKRREELDKAIAAARILGTDKVRIFSFTRAMDPAAVTRRCADEINALAEIAGKAHVRLLIENEGACNVGSAAELVALLKLVKSRWVGINWDPLNAEHSREVAFPDGYNLLPAKRIWNVQIKGRSILPDEKERMDWTAIFRRLEKDGYRGQVGLETHIFGEIQVQKSHESIKEILRLVTT